MGSNTVAKTTIGKNSFQIDCSGGTGDTYGILGGSVDGSNTTFTVSLGSYVSGSLEVQLNGQLLTQGSAEDWEETTPASGTFTLSIAPEIGDILIVKYQYQTVTTGNADTLDGHHSTDFVTNTVAGEFENKIIDGDKNTLLDIVYSSIKSTDRSGSDTTLITGTKGTDGDLAQWNSDGDLVDSKTPPTGDIVGTTDTQTLTNKTLTGPLFQGIVGGWIFPGVTWEYVSVDDPTGVFRVNADVTTELSVGMRIKMTNGGHTIYGIITAVGSYSGGYTNITFLHEIDPTDSLALYLMANSAITANYYSTQKAPFGFPLNPTHWSILSSTGGTRYHYIFSDVFWVRPTTDGTPNGTAYPDVSVPLGLWYLKGSVSLSFVGDANTDDNFRYKFAIVDSNTATPVSGADLIKVIHITQQPSTNSPYSRAQIPISFETIEEYTAKKTKRLLISSDGDYGDVIVLDNGLDSPYGSHFRWTCAYL